MYTSILANKQSTINSYMYFFFPFPHTKKVLGERRGHKLEFYHRRFSAGFGRAPGWAIEPQHSDAKPGGDNGIGTSVGLIVSDSV